MRCIGKVTLALLLLFAVERFCHSRTEGFSLLKIGSDLTFDPRFEVKQEEAPDIFNQKFTFLGSGITCYAFESEDKQYVIKFFKHHHLRPFSWILHFPLPETLKNSLKTKYQKQERIFLRCKMAFESLKEETGLLYMHLNKTENRLGHATIVDKLNIAHTISLDNTEFYLQKKGELLDKTLADLMKNNQSAEAKVRIRDLFEFFLTMYKKGVHHCDMNFHTNIAFAENHPILIDLGALRFSKTPKDYTPLLQKPMLEFLDWIKLNYPMLQEDLCDDLENAF